VDRDAYRTGLDDAEPTQPADPLRPMLEHASKNGVAVQPLEFVSRDIPTDIARVADEHQADLVLMGFHKSVIGRTVLGGTVHRVMAGTRTDVAVFVDRGFKGGRKIMVPYLGGRHDRLALELAARLGRQAEAQVTVLHVVQPERRNKSEQNAVKATERVFGDSAQSPPVHVRIVENDSPVQAVLDAGKDFDVVIIGVSEEWGLSSQLFGWRPERIAEGLTTSLLIVRHHSERPADEASERLRSIPQEPVVVAEIPVPIAVPQLETKVAQD
jgi:nucleotide-binding universal stress UspA family protein